MFRDRRDAGRQLAELLVPYAASNPVVLGLPRGGVVVAAEVAARLEAPLDILVVRKLGSPWQPELGLGAIAEGGVRVLNEGLVADEGLSPAQLDRVTQRERAELERRVALYRRGHPRLDLRDRTVLVIDDGLATGFTARAAVEAVRGAGARRIILAVPVASGDRIEGLQDVVDEVAAVDTPPWFFAIGEFYEDFGQISDAEIVAILDEAPSRAKRGGHVADELPR
ncbi:MAG: phosphoribosyltransferase [Chloroflexi bacterium]|nr:phosphoribosyltransferase [Chloroflexota bacterium]